MGVVPIFAQCEASQVNAYIKRIGGSCFHALLHDAQCVASNFQHVGNSNFQHMYALVHRYANAQWYSGGSLL